ncbi:MAG: winged helix-turn-helix domain-containing protein [Chloroflexota bacterium]
MVLGPDIVFDYNSGSLVGPAATVNLTPIEGNLLRYLAESRRPIVPRQELLERVWQIPYGSGPSHVLRSHVKNLRHKLRRAAPGIDLLVTSPGRGYGLRIDSNATD